MDDLEFENYIRDVEAGMYSNINELEKRVQLYGSFNVIGNSVLRTQLDSGLAIIKKEHEPSPVTPEYVALICLKAPPALGVYEFTQMRSVAEGHYEIDRLAKVIISSYAILHHGRYGRPGPGTERFDIQFFAERISAEEMLVRHESFEEHHWELLEGLYSRYDDYFRKKLGFTISEAIRLCLTFADHHHDVAKIVLEETRKSAKEKTREILDYKHRGVQPQNFWPQDMLDNFKRMDDRAIEIDFQQYSITWQMVTIGDKLSVTAKNLAEMEELPIEVVQAFLGQMSIGFGEIKPDFSKPEIMHPLKDRPLIMHEGRYICPSIALLDYSLDRRFAEALQKDNKMRGKYKDWRHEYLLEKGMEYLSAVLKPTEHYANLTFDGGEMDGFLGRDGNAFFLEAKGHRVTDRAKQGYIDRLENHVDEIVKASYDQGLKAYDHLFGKANVRFRDKQNRVVTLDGTKYKQAFFISLTFESLRAISVNLKVGNALGLFESHTFPWIVCLYDLRVVCEHMEGPAYLIHYLTRRKHFFQYKKFLVSDEVDLLGYYLKQNLVFRKLMERRYAKSDIIYLETLLPAFNAYYFYLQDSSRRPAMKMVHYSTPAVKGLVKALEDCELDNGVTAAVEVLNLKPESQQNIITTIARMKKQYRGDCRPHDSRVGGENDDGKGWVFCYWVGKDEPDTLAHFRQFCLSKFKEMTVQVCVCIFDSSANGYGIKDILLFRR